MVSFNGFPLFLHFLTSLIKLIPWLKFFHRQKEGWGHGGHRPQGPAPFPKSLIASPPDVTLHNLAPSIVSLSRCFCLLLRKPKLSSALRRSRTDSSWRWADTEFHFKVVKPNCCAVAMGPSTGQHCRAQSLFCDSPWSYISLTVMASHRVGVFRHDLSLISLLLLHFSKVFVFEILNYKR